ncbi:lysophospholipid acyltransferase family protein [Bdellovibrio sp.]|uniref:lysophospholipid acyltransferase family protein n=1 Tax=Bdellovibrio sp. TaxID=28201 RepID=UPI0039E5FACE
MKDWNYENEQWTKLPTYLKHLPLFTRHIDMFSVFMRFLWSILLKNILLKFYIRLQVKGNSFKEIYAKYPKLIIISNHSSHLDAVSIAASIPRRYWLNVYIAAAKDYFFSNPLFMFFSQHCLGAIPIDRKDRKGEAVNLILKLLTELPRMWLIIFPEGTRSKDGKIQDFKRGVSIFSEKTQTPLLFVYLEGVMELWPKGQPIPKPGKLVLHVGPVIPPGPIQEVYAAYKKWVLTINPDAFPVKEEEKKDDSEQI